MKKRLFALLCSFLFLAAGCISAFAAQDVPADVLDAIDSVIRIRADHTDNTYSTGSGFVLFNDDRHTLIVTNHHVIEGDPLNISVYTDTDVTVSAQILADSAQLDLCVLELSQPTELRALPVNVNGAQRGEAVYAIGFPGAADIMSDTAAQLSSEATVTDGIISATRQYTMSSYGAPVTLLQINAAINSGNSGGPLFNASGEVVGINTLTISDSIGVNGAIHAGELQRFLLDHALPYIDSAAPAAAPWLLPAAALCLSLAAAAVLAVLLRKKKLRTSDAGTACVTKNTPAAGAGMTASGSIPLPADTTAFAAAETAPAADPAVPAAAPAVPAADPAAPAAPRRKRRLPLSVGIVLCAAAILLAGSYCFAYFRASSLANREDFSRANRWLLPAVTQLHDPGLIRYISAGLAFEQRDFHTAAAVFDELGQLRSAALLAQESRYYLAAQLADANRFDEALELYRQLAEAGYPDAAQKIPDTRFRQASYILYEDRDYPMAAHLFDELRLEGYDKAAPMADEACYQWALALIEEEDFFEAYRKLDKLDGYADSRILLSDLAVLLQADAIAAYQKGDYLACQRLFSAIAPYGFSEDYLTLCSAHLAPNRTPDKKADALLDIFYLEDAASLLVSCTDLAIPFLSGHWYSDSIYSFEIDPDTHSSLYRLPSPDINGGHYTIENGIYYVTTSNGTKHTLFRLTPLSPDCIEFYCYSNSSYHTLYRR